MCIYISTNWKLDVFIYIYFNPLNLIFFVIFGRKNAGSFHGWRVKGEPRVSCNQEIKMEM